MSKEQKLAHCQSISVLIADALDQSERGALVHAWALAMQDLLSSK